MTLFGDLIISLIIILFVFWWLYKYGKNREFYKNIPGPPPLPIVGNALDLKSSTVLLPVLQKYIKEYGDLVKIQIGPTRQYILAADHRFLETILSSTKIINKSVDYNSLHSWLGSGLLTSEAPKWKKHRRILTPAFHFQILEQFIEVFESCGAKLSQKLEIEAGKKSVDVYPFITLCTLDLICESTMGININAQDKEDSDYVRSVKEMLRILMERSLSPIQMYDFLYPFTRNFYKEKKALKILHDHTDRVILARRQELEKTKNHDSKKRKPFLDLLLETSVDGRPLTNIEIREEVDTFMFEGHDTTASAISFTLFCLANHQNIQEKVLEEQRYIFAGQKDPNVSYTDLQNMKYLEQVIKESLRLYPSVPIFGRVTTKEVDFDNISLPDGDNIIIFAYGIHRNPKYFQNPDEFIPERFDTIDGKLPYAYIPFSAGPRNCIGQKFAMLEMKSTVSKVVRKFELGPASPKHELILAAEAVLKSANGVKISLNLRK